MPKGKVQTQKLASGSAAVSQGSAKSAKMAPASPIAAKKSRNEAPAETVPIKAASKKI